MPPIGCRLACGRGGPAITARARRIHQRDQLLRGRPAGQSPLPQGFTLADGFARVTGESWSAGYTLGALAELSPATRIGASYRSQLRHRLEGNATFNVPAALVASPRFQNTSAVADLKTPEIVSLAGSHKVSPELTLLAEAQWTNWSVIKALNVKRSDGSTLIAAARAMASHLVRQYRRDLPTRS